MRNTDRNDQNGFAHLLILLLLLLVIAAVAFTGWKIAHHDKQNDTNNASKAQAATKPSDALQTCAGSDQQRADCTLEHATVYYTQQMKALGATPAATPPFKNSCSTDDGDGGVRGPSTRSCMVDASYIDVPIKNNTPAGISSQLTGFVNEARSEGFTVKTEPATEGSTWYSASTKKDSCYIEVGYEANSAIMSSKTNLSYNMRCRFSVSLDFAWDKATQRP